MPLARRLTSARPDQISGDAPEQRDRVLQDSEEGQVERGTQREKPQDVSLGSPTSDKLSGKDSLDLGVGVPILGPTEANLPPRIKVQTPTPAQDYAQRQIRGGEHDLNVPPPVPSASSSQTVVDELQRDPFRSSPTSEFDKKGYGVDPLVKAKMDGQGNAQDKVEPPSAGQAEKPHPGLHHDHHMLRDRPGIMRNASHANTNTNSHSNNGPLSRDPEKFAGDNNGHRRSEHGGAFGAFRERFSNKNALKGSGVVPRIIGEKDFADQNGHAGTSTQHTGHNANNRARFEKEPGSFDWTLKETWMRVKLRLRNPSHPSSSSQLESALGEDSISAMGSHRPRGARSATGGNSSVGRTPSNCQAGYEDDEIIGSGDRGLTEPVSVVAVESDLRQFVPAAKSDNGSAANTGSVVNNGGTQHGGATSSHRPDTEASTTQPSWVARMAQGGSFGAAGRNRRKSGDDGSSIRRDRRTNVIKRTWLYEMVAERAWPVVAHFCDSKFPEPSKEKSYLKEVHFTLRRGAICASLCEFWA